MHEPDDSSLLREYVERASEAAFATLVSRHVNKVYSVALRHVRNPHQAEEITQAVFVILARKAATLSRNVILSGWLYHTTRLSAVTFIRSEIRRARREQEALLETMSNESDARAWSEIAPLLDEAIGELNEKDRLAIVLRFFDGKSMSEVGANLGLGEDAAKMRVSRALDRLRAQLSRRGIAQTSSALAAVMTNYSVQAAPSAFAGSVATSAIAESLVAAGKITLVKGVLTAMAWTKLKTAVAGVIIAGSIATPFIVKHVAEANMREAQNKLQAQRDQLAGLKAEQQRLERLTQSIALTQKQSDDLNRLRGVAAALREKAKEFPHLQEDNAQLKSQLGLDKPKSPVEAKEDALSRMSNGRDWIMAFILYANDHGGALPTNFTQATSYVSDKAKFGTDPNDQFEIIYQGSMASLAHPGDTIVLRGTEPSEVVSGGQKKWINTYVFADGHAEIHNQPQSDFTAFEQQHSPAPPADAP